MKYQKLFKGSIEIIQLSLSALIFIILPLVIFTIITSKTSLLGVQSFVVLTGSMEPTIPTGSVIYTQKQPNYQVGDIIAFKSQDKIITHRISQIIDQDNKLYFQTWGDANNSPDSTLIASQDILGRNIFRAMNVGKLILFIKTIPGFLLLIVLPLLAMIGVEVFNIKKEFEKQIEKKILQKLAQSL